MGFVYNGCTFYAEISGNLELMTTLPTALPWMESVLSTVWNARSHAVLLRYHFYGPSCLPSTFWEPPLCRNFTICFDKDYDNLCAAGVLCPRHRRSLSSFCKEKETFLWR